MPHERRDWNRPRTGKDHRNGKDIYPEQFAATFPFRGVEFGNWVNQIERSACLNEAYDALMDMALVLGVPEDEVSLENMLAIAFGARGSGKASAHYEPVKRVINLTKTRGAGSLAHEWFHALDNHVLISQGNPLLYASESPEKIADSGIAQVFQSLRGAIKANGFYERSQKCDAYKTKSYWSTMIELCARGFEKYIITKLDELGWHNDYLANIKTFEGYEKPEMYPYPSDSEIKALIPYYDSVIKSVLDQNEILKQTA